MQLSHTLPVVSAAFDDPNIVSCAGLVPMMKLARQAQLRQGLADEDRALARLSRALAAGAPEAELLQAGAALKGPFVKAYTAFGWPAGETPALAG